MLIDFHSSIYLSPPTRSSLQNASFRTKLCCWRRTRSRRSSIEIDTNHTTDIQIVQDQVNARVVEWVHAVCSLSVPIFTRSWQSRAWACTQLALGPYTIVQGLAIPLQIQPQCFAFFSAVSWAQCLHYGKELSATKSIVCLVSLLVVLAGAEVGSVFGLRVCLSLTPTVIVILQRSSTDAYRLGERLGRKYLWRFSDI